MAMFYENADGEEVELSVQFTVKIYEYMKDATMVDSSIDKFSLDVYSNYPYSQPLPIDRNVISGNNLSFKFSLVEESNLESQLQEKLETFFNEEITFRQKNFPQFLRRMQMFSKNRGLALFESPNLKDKVYFQPILCNLEEFQRKIECSVDESIIITPPDTAWRHSLFAHRMYPYNGGHLMIIQGEKVIIHSIYTDPNNPNIQRQIYSISGPVKDVWYTINNRQVEYFVLVGNKSVDFYHGDDFSKPKIQINVKTANSTLSDGQYFCPVAVSTSP